MRLTRLGWCWLGALISIALVGLLVGQLDKATELAPDHSDSIEVGLAIGALAAVFSAVFIFWQSQGALARRLAISLLVAPLFSVLGFTILVSQGSSLYYNWRDFSTGATRTFTGLMTASRAYHTHGKNQSWYIQTEPVWANLEITPEDYDFMIDHRPPSDRASGPDEIKSKGLFCIRVVAQQAGQAFRILNAGTHKLPQGSVGMCSTLIAANPSIIRIR